MTRARIRKVISAVAYEYGYTVGVVLSDSREKPVAAARQLAMWLCRQDVKDDDGKTISFKALGRAFGLDHSTIVTGCQAVDARMERVEWSELAERVRQRMRGELGTAEEVAVEAAAKANTSLAAEVEALTRRVETLERAERRT